MRTAALLVALALAGLPAISRAQAPGGTPALDPRLSSLDPSTHATLAATIDSARRAGLPGEPLVDKALEGASKGAAPDRIVYAVRNLSHDLGVARSALGPDASEAELVAGVSALRAGARSDVLRRLKAARGSQSTLLPLAVLSDLVAQGTPVDRAAQVVLSLADRGATDAQYRTLPPSAGNASERNRGVPSGATPGQSSGAGTPAAGGTPAAAPVTEAPAVTPPVTDAQRPTPPRGRPATAPDKGRSSGRP